MYTDIPLKVIILSVILELPLSVWGVGRRTQPISKLLNDLLITSALNPNSLVESALNPTCLLQVSDFSTHLYLRSGPLLLGKLAHKSCELGKDGGAIHLLVWRSSNRIAIILYQGYANSNTFLWFCSFFIELNTLSSGTMTSGAQLSESEW